MNRLAQEKSAYLQHAKNQKINWYPWSEEAFEKASLEGKPVFLSSGAVWCHWCHVMAQESFEDDEVARLLNECYISVKLDRDERPDVDRRYQQAVAAMGYGGGWPLSVFLTPDRKPFYGGTYFPLDESFGRPGFKAILKSISDLYREKQKDVFEHSEKLLEMLKPEPIPAKEVNESLIDEGVAHILSGYDQRYGGFGQAPKFPMSGAIEFLINRAFLTKEKPLLDAVKTTLLAMARGGIHDQLGGGFHRYSTDQEWIIPHFEKMADDNAWLLRNYIDAYEVFGTPYFKETALGIINFFRTELSHPEGGFYASQDADIVPEDEGGYFLWTDEDLRSALNEDEYRVLSLYLFHEKGRMRHDPSKRVLFLSRSMDDIAQELAMEPALVAHIIKEGKAKLLNVRSLRQKPFIDTAFYTSLNGLVISAFLKAYRTLGDENIKELALKSIGKVMDVNVKKGRLFHAEGVKALLDDYIFFSDALIAAYEATGNTLYLEQAKGFMDTCIEGFRDKEWGGFFDTDEEVIGMRLKGIEDIPHPAANSLAILVLLRLSLATNDEAYRNHARKALEAFAPYGQSHGIHGGYYFSALDGFFHMVELTLNTSSRSDLSKTALALFHPYKAVRYGEDKGNVMACYKNICHEPFTIPSDIKAFFDAIR
ncbi:MAG: thioredoxin domain-containing protein [Syntrophus sp. (in: bacteria)]|nr:thioredoxin domain-containing protein [Syntrophus sp. (in: bacteria)]